MGLRNILVSMSLPVAFQFKKNAKELLMDIVLIEIINHDVVLVISVNQEQHKPFAIVFANKFVLWNKYLIFHHTYIYITIFQWALPDRHPLIESWSDYPCL